MDKVQVEVKGSGSTEQWEITSLQQSMKRFQRTRALKLTVHCHHLACLQGTSQLRYSSCTHGMCSILEQGLPRQDQRADHQ